MFDGAAAAHRGCVHRRARLFEAYVAGLSRLPSAALEEVAREMSEALDPLSHATLTVFIPVDEEMLVLAWPASPGAGDSHVPVPSDVIAAAISRPRGALKPVVQRVVDALLVSSCDEPDA
jgi:hypothetical protein